MKIFTGITFMVDVHTDEVRWISRKCSWISIEKINEWHRREVWKFIRMNNYSFWKSVENFDENSISWPPMVGSRIFRARKIKRERGLNSMQTKCWNPIKTWIDFSVHLSIIRYVLFPISFDSDICGKESAIMNLHRILKDIPSITFSLVRACEIRLLSFFE